jgi:hypothetical protein
MVTWILLLLWPDVMDLEHNLCDIIKKIFLSPPFVLSGCAQSTSPHGQKNLVLCESVLPICGRCTLWLLDNEISCLKVCT